MIGPSATSAFLDYTHKSYHMEGGEFEGCQTRSTLERSAGAQDV